MKRNLFCVVLTLAMALSLAACSGKPAQDGQNSGGQSGTSGQSSRSEQSSNQQSPSNLDVDAYVFRSGNCTIAIDDDMANVLTVLKEPQSYFEAESCAFEGLDKTYTYSGFVITTRPDGDKDFINSILLTDDSVTTPEGIFIGSLAEDVTATYGMAQVSTDTFLSYTKGNTTLNFVLDSGKVFSIEYLGQ